MADVSRVVKVPLSRSTAPVGERLADRIFALARQVAALHPPGRSDPERFWRDKSELASQLAEVGRRLG